jgi:hypothetical protein
LGKTNLVSDNMPGTAKQHRSSLFICENLYNAGFFMGGNCEN